MKTFKRIAALIGVILLLGMYVVAFVLSFMRSPAAEVWFRGALGCTIIVPVFIYIVMLMAKVLKPKRSELFDGVIFADNHVLKEENGRDTYYAKEWQKEFQRKGYRMYHFTGDTDSLESYLTELESRDKLKPERYLYIDSDKEAIKISRKLKFAGLLFKDFPDVTERLESLGVVL